MKRSRNAIFKYTIVLGAAMLLLLVMEYLKIL